MRKRSFSLFFLALFSLISRTVYAVDQSSIMPPAPLNERVIVVPGNPERPAVRLQVTVMTPDGPGPFPLAIMNHGASGAVRTDLEPRYRYTISAYYFLSRGYAVALPMMRGFSGSEGTQGLNGCNQEEVGLNNARDIRAVAEYMAKQPYIDPRHMVMAGQSMGGWNTLAFGSLQYPPVKGLINFVGGINISNCASSLEPLAQGAADFGAKTRVPSLWFYGDNDSKFAPRIWRTMYQLYTSAGGHAELVAFGSYMNDSHQMLSFPESMPIWAPRVDAFLKKIGMPYAVLHPAYLPTPFPPASHYAAIDDVDAVPYMNDQGRALYRRFLSATMPRVFVLSPGNGCAMYSGGFDPLAKAMQVCQKQGQKCQVYAVDDRVTWRRPTPAPAPSGFAAIDDAAAIPYLNDDARKVYLRYVSMRKPKAFAIAPDGGWGGAALGDDPLATALATCARTHQGCSLYAVDDQVVWRGDH